MGQVFVKLVFQENLNHDSFPIHFWETKNKLIMITGHQKDFYIGLEAEEIRGILNLNYPIKQGNIIDWRNGKYLEIYIYK